MTITYRTDGAWGAGKGSNLTPVEVDNNFWDLAEWRTEFEANLPDPVGIANITFDGSLMTIVLDDAQEFSHTLPRAPYRPPVTETISTTTYDPVLADVNTYKRCTNVAGCAITLPTNEEVAFPVDTVLVFRQCAVQGISIDAPTDVTINGIDGYLNETAIQGALIHVKKVGTDEWDLWGLLVEEPTA